MASYAFANGIANLNKALDWGGANTIKAMLITDGYTPGDSSADTLDYIDDINTYKASGTTDQELTQGNRSTSIDTANNYVYLDGPNTLTWTAVAGSQTVRGVAIFRDTGTASTSEIICWCQFSSDLACNGSDIEVTFNTNGVLRYTYTTS